ncbi:RING-H2 finger protein ATL70-like [Trifolium pratense]|uniref:RING-H2 finger protein ATL70-like n=1 Tax=Trifolium pratense TaxID=57577 RepID=A0A2K3LET4_TRIPR|nr:RING-H2 finger protein ATL70-like [Trifolium pratense]PNX77042.1 RING-H2 finger protein ATL70-like [Trifolium pratense]
MMNNNSTSQPQNNDDFDANGFTYILTFVFALVFLILTIVVACVRLRMSRGPDMINILSGFPPHRQEDSIMEQGLRRNRDTSFEGYPKMLYSQIEKNILGGSSTSSCSICLGDYKESDILRLLPDCGHLYHVACVDPWLRLHSTCPICRKPLLASS